MQFNALLKAWRAKQRRPARAYTVEVEGRAFMEAEAEELGGAETGDDQGQNAMAAAFAGLAAAQQKGGV